MIESEGFDGANGVVPGFRFAAANGLLESNGAVFKNITVNDGIFNNISAKEGVIDSVSVIEANFRGGTISVGPLFVSNEKTPNTQEISFPATERIIDFYARFGSGRVYAYYGGKYGDYDLYSFNISTKVSNTPTTQIYRVIDFYTSVGNITVNNHYTSNSNPSNTGLYNTIGKPLVIFGGGGGNTIKLSGLPTTDPHEEGKLYTEQGDNLLRVSKG